MENKIKKTQYKTVEPLLKSTYTNHVPSQTICPKCRVDLMRVGIDDIATTNDVCKCDKVDYSHVVEQLWHKKCLMEYLKENPEKQTDYRYIGE
jgi:hypothetical protein